MGVEPQTDDKVFKLIWVEAGGVIKINLQWIMHRSSVEAYCWSLRCQRKPLLLVFSFKKHNIIAKYIYKFLFFFTCMHKLCKIYLHEIFCRVKFHAFLQRVKGYFLLFQNVILYFCLFKRDTTIINSFSFTAVKTCWGIIDPF